MASKAIVSPLFKRMETDIDNYLTGSVEISEGVFFSQYKTIVRINKFKNRDLSGSKINSDLSYNYYYDIISPRVDGEVKNLRFDTKNVLVFSASPRKDFAAVFITNAMLKKWMAENGEDIKLKTAIEEFVSNGNIGFKKVDGGYEFVDHLNTYITNQRAETVDDTDIVERHELTASQIKRMSSWDQDVASEVIKECGNKVFSATVNTTSIESSNKKYEVYEFTGEVNEKEFNMLSGKNDGSGDTYFLAKVVVAGLNKGGTGEKYVLFAEKLTDKMSDHYIYAHRGKYEGRFWRLGMIELLFDHQIRANEIGNQLARGLDWASKVVFRSKDSRVMQNIRADMDNGDVVITEDLTQVDVRMRGLDQLIADWNRLMLDADKLSNSFEVVRGEAPPSGTPFRSLSLLDANAGKLYTFIRQKVTLPYRRVFREWVLPSMLKDLKGTDVFRFVGDEDVVDQLRDVMVESWYIDNLVKIGYHTKETADAIKSDKKEELRKFDPVIENVKDIWKGVLPRFFVTITDENSDIADNLTDMMALLNIETDPNRRNFLLDTIYKVRGIPIPPAQPEVPPEQPTNPMLGQDQNQQKGQVKPQQKQVSTPQRQVPVVQ